MQAGRRRSEHALALPAADSQTARSQQLTQSAEKLMGLPWKALWPTHDPSMQGYRQVDTADFLKTRTASD